MFDARNALSLLNETSSCPRELFAIGEGLQLYSTVLDCISLVFSSQEGLSNENLDLWISTVGAVLDLVHKFYKEDLISDNEGVFVFQFLCLVLESFARLLRDHLPRKMHFVILLISSLSLCCISWVSCIFRLMEVILIGQET